MSKKDAPQPITAVIRRRIKAGSEASFEALMQEFIAFVLKQPGHLGINVIRPVSGSRDYTVLDRFATDADRQRFTASSEYKSWMERLREVSDAEPQIEELGGLAFWFTLPDHPALRPPPKPKMALLTLLGVYPLATLFPLLIVPLTPGWPSWLQGLISASLIVASLTWLVMPTFTRVFRPWLYPSDPGR